VDGQVAAQQENAALRGGASIDAGVTGELDLKRTRHDGINTREARPVPHEENIRPLRERHTSLRPGFPTGAARRLHPCPHMKRAGFTLIELLTVVAIIGLLAVVAIPKLTGVKERAQVAAMKSDLRNLVTLEENYFAQNLKYTSDLGAAYTVSAGNLKPVITVTGDGWAATLTSVSTGQTCAIFMGSTPANPATKEGAPACAKGGGATVTQ